MKERQAEAICPFCQTINNCMAHSVKPCWCRQVEIPQELLKLVPKDKKHKVCICLKCIEAFKDTPEEFLAGIDNSSDLLIG
jgi:hypothetical protein